MRAGLYLGFPGVGKTPMAKEEPNVIDLDAGHVRKALSIVAGVPQEDIDDNELAHFVAVLADIYINEGWAVITNLPAVMEHHKVDRMYVQAAHAFRSMDASAAKLGVDRPTIQTYIEDWIMSAKAHGVPVIRLRKGLDYIFRQTRLKKDKEEEELPTNYQNGEKEPKMGEFW